MGAGGASGVVGAVITMDVTITEGATGVTIFVGAMLILSLPWCCRCRCCY